MRAYEALSRTGRRVLKAAGIRAPESLRRLDARLRRIGTPGSDEDFAASTARTNGYLERLSVGSQRPLWVAASLPPDRSGVATYTQMSLGQPDGPVAFFTPTSTIAARMALSTGDDREAETQHRVEILALKTLELATRRLPAQPVLYVLGNSEHHLETFRHLLRYGARPHDAVHLHDVYIGGLMALAFPSRSAFVDALRRTYRVEAVRHWLEQTETEQRAASSVLGPRLLARLAGARRLIVNSASAAERVRTDLAEDAQGTRVDVAFLPIVPQAPRERRADPSRVRVGHFGILDAIKQPDVLIAACDLLARRRGLELVLAGFNVARYVNDHRIRREYMEILDSPSDAELADAMSSVDCAVQLRYPDSGESSGVVNQLLALRRPVVCTDTGSFAELAGAVHLVPPDVTPERLAITIDETATKGWLAEADGLVARWNPSAFEALVRSLLEVDRPG